jgi:hypothetical protein
MELNEIKSMWRTYDTKLDKALKLNLHCIQLLQTQKMKSKLTPLLWQRAFEIILHSIAIFLLFAFLYKNFFQFPYAASAIILIAFYAIAFINSLKQLIIIKRMDYSNDVVTIQSSLVMLETHIVNYARLVVLCIPAFLAFPVVISKAIIDLNLKAFADFNIITQSHGSWWTAQLAATIVLIPLCIWFYMQVSYKNVHKKWVKDFIQKSSGRRVRKAIEFINELESLKHDIN